MFKILKSRNRQEAGEKTHYIPVKLETKQYSN